MGLPSDCTSLCYFLRSGVVQNPKLWPSPSVWNGHTAAEYRSWNKLPKERIGLKDCSTEYNNQQPEAERKSGKLKMNSSPQVTSLPMEHGVHPQVNAIIMYFSCASHSIICPRPSAVLPREAGGHGFSEWYTCGSNELIWSLTTPCTRDYNGLPVILISLQSSS